MAFSWLGVWLLLLLNWLLEYSPYIGVYVVSSVFPVYLLGDKGLELPNLGDITVNYLLKRFILKGKCLIFMLLFLVLFYMYVDSDSFWYHCPVA